MAEDVPESNNNEIGRNTPLNFSKRWITDWKKADAKDQVSMIRDLITLLGLVGVPIWWPNLKALASIDTFFIVLGILYFLVATLVYMAILYVGYNFISSRAWYPDRLHVYNHICHFNSSFNPVCDACKLFLASSYLRRLVMHSFRVGR